MSTLARILVIAVAFAADGQSAATKRPITHADVYQMTRTGRPIVSPDGQWIVYSVAQPNYDPAQASSDLWIVSPDGTSPPRRLTSSKETESGAAWSPDSTRIAFSAKRDGDAVEQIYIVAAAGGEARRMTSATAAASNPRWRPDGKAILFESAVRTGPPADKSTARAFDAMPVRFWNTWLDGAKPHVFVQEIDGLPAVDWLAGTVLAARRGFDGVAAGDGATRTLQAVWTPDGEIVFAAVANRDEMMREQVPSALYRVKFGGEPVRITPPGASFSDPAFTRDGRTLVAKQEKDSDSAHLYNLARLAVVDERKGAPRVLTGTLDRGVGSFSLTPDGAAVLFDAQDSGFTQLYRVPIAGGEPQRLFEVKEGNYGSPAMAGSTLVGTYVASTQPIEIVRIDPSKGTHQLLTDSNRAVLDALDLPKPEHFWFTAKNGKRIHSVIYLPPGLDRSKKVSTAREPARRTQRHGQRCVLDSVERAPADGARLRPRADELHRLHRFRRVVRQRHRARRAARARAGNARGGRGSDPPLSVHRRVAAVRGRRELRRLPDELVQRPHDPVPVPRHPRRGAQQRITVRRERRRDRSRAARWAARCGRRRDSGRIRARSATRRTGRRRADHAGRARLPRADQREHHHLQDAAARRRARRASSCSPTKGTGS
jgi:Tol biopolymer transport system component